VGLRSASGARARRFERRLSKEQPEDPVSLGPFSSLLAACSVTLCSTGQAEVDRSGWPVSRTRSAQEILQIEQRAAETRHLRSLINANPLPDDGRRPSKSSDMSDKSVTSDD